VQRVGVGVIGCGVISAAYLKAARHFDILDVRAVADLNRAAAEARGAEFGVPAVTIEALLADPAIDIVLNLTIPKAHAAVSLQAIEAGKHVHSEKPLAISAAEGRRVVAAAETRGLRVGCAPDTFLGGAHQEARRLIDAGAIGTPVGGTAFFLCPGHERWHPAPAFYYEVGGGPVLDMGPYYITDLVNLLGPVAEVAAMVSMPRAERVVTSEPLNGTTIPVHVPTHAAATLRFVSGAVVQVALSFDVWAHRHIPLEIYGTTGSLIVPDPNWFGGELRLFQANGDWQEVEHHRRYADDNYRIIGVADMARAIRENRPHRASGALALHVLEVMEAFGRSSDSRSVVAIETRPERPALLEDAL
jgi:predicted dehydrogenase